MRAFRCLSLITSVPGILSLSVRIRVYGEAVMDPQISVCTGEKGEEITHDEI